jgi:hypothetical protein
MRYIVDIIGGVGFGPKTFENKPSIVSLLIAKLEYGGPYVKGNVIILLEVNVRGLVVVAHS